MDDFFLIQQKTPNWAFFLLSNCRYRNSFTARRATTIQYFASTLGFHTCTKTVCTNTARLRRLICTFCCHDLIPLFFFFLFCSHLCPSSIIRTLGKIRLCVYLITGFIKTQLFYSNYFDFIKPVFFRPSKIK